MNPGLSPKRVRALRPAHSAPDPWKILGTVEEQERGLSGALRSAATLFLAGAECPFSCVFCDLWRHTTPSSTPVGAIPAQIRQGLDKLSRPPHTLKLYNASNFFDARAVPVEDDEAILELLQAPRRVVVECHPRFVEERALRYTARLSGTLQVALGLETVHPRALRHLGKGASIADFRRAAALLLAAGAEVRVFLLIGAPFIPAAELESSVVESARFARDLGARHISLIPLRGGNGATEELARRDEYTPPTLQQVEGCYDACMRQIEGPVLSLDLWDLDQLSHCPHCYERRRARLLSMNLSGRQEADVVCGCEDSIGVEL